MLTNKEYSDVSSCLDQNLLRIIALRVNTINICSPGSVNLSVGNEIRAGKKVEKLPEFKDTATLFQLLAHVP